MKRTDREELAEHLYNVWKGLNPSMPAWHGLGVAAQDSWYAVAVASQFSKRKPVVAEEGTQRPLEALVEASASLTVNETKEARKRLKKAAIRYGNSPEEESLETRLYLERWSIVDALRRESKHAEAEANDGSDASLCVDQKKRAKWFRRAAKWLEKLHEDR
jgi:hypothetical protein